MTALALSDLSLCYPGAGRPAVAGLTLDVVPGEMTVLLGPSGCGKSTVLKLVAGLLAPDAGDILFDGRSVLGVPPERRGAVMVFQNHLLFAHMSVAENVGFGLRMRGLPKAEVAARAARMLEMVQLPGLGARRPAELSGGQQQRVALARALVVAPRVLLLDEPLSGLDASLRYEMRDLVRSLQREFAITTLFVTHDQEEAAALADRVALMLDGRLRQHDRAEVFYRRPADIEVARFFGGRNFIAGRAAGGLFHSALGALVVPADAREGPGTLTFRPESVRLGPGGENALQAHVVDRVFLGTQVRLTLACRETRFEAAMAPDEAGGIVPGQAIEVHVPRSALWVLG